MLNFVVRVKWMIRRKKIWVGHKFVLKLIYGPQLELADLSVGVRADNERRVVVVGWIQSSPTGGVPLAAGERKRSLVGWDFHPYFIIME